MTFLLKRYTSKRVKRSIETVRGLKKLKEKLAQDFIAETKARLEAEDAFESMKQQLQSRDEDYNMLLNEHNATTEKSHELQHELRKCILTYVFAEETVARTGTAP